MPIEDVHYLKENSKRESYIFMTNSADRDKAAYPTPSEYVVEFSYPFRNVIGIEVLYASIPRTMYNVDYINNSIVFAIYSEGFGEDPKTKTVEIEPGEYTVQTLVVALNAILHMHVNGDDTMPYAYITAETTTNPPDIQNKIMFRCSYPFRFYMESSTCAETLGFDELTQSSESQKPLSKQRYVYNEQDRRMYTSVYMPTAQIPASKLRIATVFEGPRGVITRIPITETTQVAQRFTPSTRSYMHKLYAALYSPDNTASVVNWEIRTELDGDSIMSGQIAVSFSDGTLSDSNDIASDVIFEPDQDYWLVFSYGSGEPSIYYNDVLTTSTPMLVKGNEDDTWASFDTNGIFYNLSATINMIERFNYIEAPGIYVLTGPNYIVLRCPEIENNSFRSLAYTKHNIGLGTFRLGVVGYSENRLDFNVRELREFHPIGKLPRMSVRLELPNGQLYDFKGVNHTITFAIYYLEPIQKDAFKTSILNPNYDGNFIGYMYHQDEQESDSDEQEEDFSRGGLMNTFRKNEQYFLPENIDRRTVDYMQHHRRFIDDE